MTTLSTARTFRRPSTATLAPLGDLPIASVFVASVSDGELDLLAAGVRAGRYDVMPLEDGRILLQPLAAPSAEPETAPDGRSGDDAPAPLGTPPATSGDEPTKKTARQRPSSAATERQPAKAAKKASVRGGPTKRPASQPPTRPSKST